MISEMDCLTWIALTLNAYFPTGPKTVPAMAPATCVTSAIPSMTFPTALVTGAFPTALMASTDVLARKFMPALLQEQAPLMQEVEEKALGSADFGHEQSLATVHDFELGTGFVIN
jgi:hypothetical protein